ncbi:Sap, sulfolipid-1-addressing protein [Agreia bicolorata]|uniref:Sap, sulfolipid-1-addressing protein n=1 Tax=Agreia bicolorata TaxID=110935 RepID=A0A1T4WT05_9MICO|nr:GAP family protein [Agreia bicolorata]SKA80500.1 Sap, sulfolipid-1-addressing protein [Agreia bicolorata]
MNSLDQLVPLAVGMVISPLPIVAIVAIVLAPRGRTSAPAFLSVFTLVSLVFVVIGMFASAGASATVSGGSKVIVLVLTIAVMIGFAILAVVSWLTRPATGSSPKVPSWLATIDTITPERAAGLGFVMAITNTKNIPLALKGGSLIGDAHLQIGTVILLCIAIALAGSLALIIPTALSALRSESINAALKRLKTEMTTHNAIIMTVMFAMLAAVELSHLLRQLS